MEIMQAMLNSKKVKYVIMEQLVKRLPTNTEEINVFINVDSLLRGFYNPKIYEAANSLSDEDKHLLSSELINIVAHYRHFFWSRYRIPSNFFLYYSDKEASYPTKLNPDYKHDFYSKRLYFKPEFNALNKMIYKNLELATILSEYLPNIYIINTGTLEPSVLPYHIINKNQKVQNLLNLVITNELSDYQLTNLNNTFILDLKSDDSKIITREEIIPSLLKRTKMSNTELDSNFFNAILAISGNKKQNILGIPGYGPAKTVKLIEKLIKDGSISNNEESGKLNITADKYFNDSDLEEIIIKNYNAISLANLYKNISPKETYAIKSAIKNKSDNMSLMEINNQYYTRYPLMLIELMEGEC